MATLPTKSIHSHIHLYEQRMENIYIYGLKTFGGSMYTRVKNENDNNLQIREKKNWYCQNGQFRKFNSCAHRHKVEVVPCQMVWTGHPPRICRRSGKKRMFQISFYRPSCLAFQFVHIYDLVSSDFCEKNQSHNDHKVNYYGQTFTELLSLFVGTLNRAKRVKFSVEAIKVF
jgi:hypothetical protein